MLVTHTLPFVTTVVEALESRDKIANLNRMHHESWDEIRMLRGC